jgi:methylenetetrahydrofolate dehydrogenase (NADP+)/methenyltetrahydrofolate cyclohydrolase
LILDGKVVAQKVLDDVRTGVARLKDRTGTVPTLAVVLVGDFAPSKVYVANKKRAADTSGIASQDHIHPAGLERTALLALLRSSTPIPGCTGSCSSCRCRRARRGRGDRGDRAREGRGRASPAEPRTAARGAPGVVPCTPAGLLEILDHYGASSKGAEAVVIGRSRLVGKPLAQLLLARHATVTMCHTRTRDLAAHTRPRRRALRGGRTAAHGDGRHGEAGRVGDRRRRSIASRPASSSATSTSRACERRARGHAVPGGSGP